MENAEQSLNDFESALKRFHLTRYDELPDLDLYMEQVVAYVNRNLAVFCKGDDNGITSSMINNYVKHGIIPPPVKKKYTRRHIAYIYAVYFLKQVLTMSEIKTVIRHQIKCSDEGKAYEYFCGELERALKSCCRSCDASEKSFAIDDYDIKYSAIAIANKLYAQKVIALFGEPKEPEEEKKTDKKDKKDKKEISAMPDIDD